MISMKIDRIVKSSQEQAVASWINYLNQSRLDSLMKGLQSEQVNFENATDTIDRTLKIIENDIVNNGKGRGGQKGMHGFIAEVAECGIGNARSQIAGKAPVYEWINDNGPEDLKRAGILIQQKFVQAGNHLSLQAIQKHLEKYPSFIKNGGVYQIPADHYQKIEWLRSIPESQANKMATADGTFSLKQWREVHDFFAKGKVPFTSIEPSALDYDSVQKGRYKQTLNTEKSSLKKYNDKQKANLYRNSKPSLKEGLRVLFAGAAVEGGVELCQSIRKKCKEKRLCDFNEDDWLDVMKKTSKGFSKGGIRATSIYLLTNYTATPAAVANAILTASFGMAEQAHFLQSGALNEQEFIENSEMICLEATVSALSSFAGQVIIPVPVLGAVIGNSVGVMMYQIAKDHLSSREQRLLKKHLESIQQLKSAMDRQYKAYIRSVAEEMETFMQILDQAFVMDVHVAFEGSIKLARACGVPSEEILDTRDKIFSYFTK